MSRVLVLGNATVDVVQRVDRLPRPGETRLGSAPRRCAGGKGLNQAVVAARAGAEVALVAAIGRDADGAFLRAAVAGEPLAAQWIEAEAPTDASSIWVAADGENMILSSAGCAASIDASRADAALARIGRGDWLLLQGNLAAEVTRRAATAARARGAAVVFNPSPITEAPAAILSIADVVVVNEIEAATLGGAAAIGAAGAQAVLLTRGAAGATLQVAGNAVPVAAPRVAAIDTAGAGDVVVGTLVALLSRGLPPERAAGLAVRAASLSVTREGTHPAFPTPEEFATLLAEPEPWRVK